MLVAQFGTQLLSQASHDGVVGMVWMDVDVITSSILVFFFSFCFQQHVQNKGYVSGKGLLQ
jgi:hypothetical protein